MKSEEVISKNRQASVETCRFLAEKERFEGQAQSHSRSLSPRFTRLCELLVLYASFRQNNTQLFFLTTLAGSRRSSSILLRLKQKSSPFRTAFFGGEGEI